MEINVLRIVFTVLLAGSQAVFIHMLIRFQRPISLDETDSESKSEVFVSVVSTSNDSVLFDYLNGNTRATINQKTESANATVKRWIDNKRGLDAALYVQYLDTNVKQMLAFTNPSDVEWKRKE